MKEIQEHKIKIYEFPETDDEEENKLVKKIKDRLPLAVVGSNTIIEVNGKRVRGRQYPWGVAEGKVFFSEWLSVRSHKCDQKFVFHLDIF